MPSSRQRETAPRLVSSRPSLHAHPSTGAARAMLALRYRPPVRTSRDVRAMELRRSPRFSQAHRRTNSGRRNARRHACRSRASRFRERVGATTYRRRSGTVTVGPGRLERARSVGTTDASTEAPRIGETRTFHDVRSRSDLGRSRSSSLARNRDARLPRRRQGRQRWSEALGGAREDNARIPCEPAPPKRARCRETPSAPVSAVALRRKTSRRCEMTRSPHDTMGARFRIRG
jgi:hypothetical protein